MKFARRNRSTRISGIQQERICRERRRRTELQLETLESRVLLAATVVTPITPAIIARNSTSVAAGATSVKWNGQSGLAVPGQYVVSSPLSAAQLQQTMRAAGLNPISVTSLATGNYGSDKYLVIDNTTSVANMNWWGQRAMGVVTAIGPNRVYHASLIPSDIVGGTTVWPATYQYSNDGTLSSVDINNQVRPAKPGADINMFNAWDLGTGDIKNVVAVLDTGAATLGVTRLSDGTTHPAHSDLFQNAWMNPGDITQDGVDEDGNGVADDFGGANFTTLDANGAIVPDNDITDIVGHGTFVSGLIGATANNWFQALGNGVNPPIYDVDEMVGMNWRVQIMPVKVLDDTGAGTSATIIAGLNYVLYMKNIEHVNIIGANLSLGGNFEGPQNGIADPAGVAQESVALQQLNNAGIIVTIAAGNDSRNNDIFPVSPANFNSNRTLVVASTNESDELSSFSNFGSRVNLAAPGEDIFSTISLDATDFADLYGPPFTPPHDNPVPPYNGTPTGFAIDGYSFASGTSFAAPMVMGAVALLKSIVPSASPDQIVSAILQGVDVLPQLFGKVSSGGRLDVFRAAEILLGNKPVTGAVDVINGKKVQGWVFDPNMGAKPNNGFVLVDGTTVIPFTTDVKRPDVDIRVYNDEGRQKMGTTRGFSVDLSSIGPGRHVIQVFAYDVSEINGNIRNANGNFFQAPTLLRTTVIEGNLLPIGNIDVANANVISGKAWDPNTDNPINVRIDIDGQTVAVVPADDFYTSRVGNHGFSYVPNLAQGMHVVKAYALDDFTGQAVLIGTKAVFGNHGLQYINIAYNSNTRILSGYVVDPDSAFDPVSIQATIDGASGQRKYFQNLANIDDPASATALDTKLTNLKLPTFPGNSQHKFEITLPNLAPGNHTINLYAFDNETGQRIELLAGLPVINNVPPTGTFTSLNGPGFTATVDDANSPNAKLWCRVDITSTTGTTIMVGQIAQSDGGDVNNPATPNVFTLPGDYTFSPGTYNAILRVEDPQSDRMVFVNLQQFVVPAAGGQPVGALNAPIASGQAISGTVTDTTGTGQTFVAVTLFVNGVASSVTAQAPQPGGAFTFTAAQVATAVGNVAGAYHIEVRAADVDGVTPDTLLGAGEYLVGVTAANQPAGTITNPTAVTVSGTARGYNNDAAPRLLLNLNNDTYNEFTITPNGNNLVPYQATTPALRRAAGNAVALQYVDPVTGNLLNLAGPAPLPSFPINLFVNQRLVVTGNLLPTGNLDSASANGIAGWVRDPDAAPGSIMYRLDIDGTIGQPQVANLLRNDLPFTQVANDKNHGFSIVPPLLTAGAHTVKLFAIDPATLDVVFVGQRTFTVLDDANKRPLGAVETLNANGATGWVQDPSTPNQPVTLELHVDGNVVATTTSSGARADIGLRNGVVVQGYSLAMPNSVAAGIHYVEVYAVDTSDNTRKVLLKAASFEVGTPQIQGHFDVANFDTVSGWVQSGANDTASPQFRLELNGVTVQTFTAAETTENGFNLRRFSFATPPLATSFNNVFRVYYVDPNTGQSILLATKVVAPVRATIGRVDVVNTTMIAGWAWSPTLPDAKVEVQILIDGIEVGVTTAGLDRAGLTGALAGHAFQFNTPVLTAGRHVFAIRFRDPVTGDYSLAGMTSVLTA